VRDGLHSLPLRFALHLTITLLVPAAMLLTRAPLSYGPLSALPAAPQAAPAPSGVDFTAPLAPLALDPELEGEAPVPDSAFAAIDALPVPALRPELLAVRPVAALVAAEEATVRGGPGTEYDKVATLGAGAPLTLVAQFGDWFKAQAADGQVVWVSAELLDADPIAADILPVAESIPAPPPPKVGQVLAEGLNLRDGPGTNYVGMHQMASGAQLDLLARYGDWFQVQAGDGRVGWVTSEFLGIGPGVVERIETVTEIPDPNPALVGVVRQARVNLRGGPGTGYQKLGALGADAQLALLAQHKDWLKIRTPQGGEGWVSRELVEVNPYVARRVPAARSIPPLPQAARRAPARGMAGVQFAPASSTSGPVSFAMQFVGARYTWGGGSPERGFDCSGFTRYVYGQFGVSLPHSSAGQYSSRYGAIVSNPSDLQPGDLVFFVNTYRRGISHVGIYIGGGNVVQALSPGRGVGVASIAGGYWAAHYYGAIRPGR
jgi:cell wall-associated NlpC family hydrolase